MYFLRSIHTYEPYVTCVYVKLRKVLTYVETSLKKIDTQVRHAHCFPIRVRRPTNSLRRWKAAVEEGCLVSPYVTDIWNSLFKHLAIASAARGVTMLSGV